MSKMNEVMIDIETMSTKTNATILTIGAIKFRHDDLKGKRPKIEDMTTFYTRITMESCAENDFDICEETKDWWEKQTEQAYFEAVLNKEGRIHIKDALMMLCDFVSDCEIFWAQGISFDYPILEYAMKKFGIQVPWKFWNLRDLRTILAITNVSLRSIKRRCALTEHNALNDCYTQILALKTAIIDQ